MLSLRGSLSLRTQLILLLGVVVLLATASLGSIAYRTTRAIIQREAVREVGITANARKQVLIRALTQQRVRVAALLKTLNIGCLPEETRCVRRVLADFVATEGAAAARIVYRGLAPITVGQDAATLANIAAPSRDQIARFEFDPGGQPYYVMQATFQQDGAVLTLRGEMQVVNQIFLNRYELGQSGETFLTDAQGSFLTPPRYPDQAADGRLNSSSMEKCLAGIDSEALDRGYRGVPVIRAFRHVPEIGGGCIMALIDQAEAFAPSRRLENQVAGVSVLLAILAIACSLIFAQLVSRPMNRLTARARSLQAGDFDSPVPVAGPAEVRMFAQTFEAMARSLKDSRTALEESSERITNIIESISDGFCAFDRRWRCTYVNAKATELSRIPRGELLGKNVWDLFSDSSHTAVYTELHRAMKDQVPIHLEEHYAPFEAWFEIAAYPIRDGLAVFVRDVTERRRINERLQETQKLESLGVLAGGIAHDFNNLLTGIIGNASMALDELPPASPVRNSIQAVVSGGERAATLTRQLLAYAGKGKFVVERLNLSDLVREIANLLRTSIPRNVQLRLELADRLPPIEGDAVQIQQLIMNLVINGAEAIGDKTEAVLVTTALREVDQSYIDQTLVPNGIAPGSYVALEVRDAGCGMAPATLARIFDPFFTTKFTGRGLGLAAAMGIVRGHKAALKVDSAPGKGSSFQVLFPASEGEPTKPLRARLDRNLAGSGTILVIDDENAVLQTAKSVLESYGYTVIVAENGKEGVEVFRKLADQVSLVLLDMTMPVMSGEEALTHLKSIRNDVRVILSSGYNEGEAARRFNGRGLAGFVQKPYTASYLADQIKTALTRVLGTVES